MKTYFHSMFTIDLWQLLCQKMKMDYYWFFSRNFVQFGIIWVLSPKMTMLGIFPTQFLSLTVRREIEMLVNFSNRVSPSLAQMVNLYFCLVFSATNHCHKKPYHFILPLSKTVQILSNIKENFRNLMLTLSNSVPKKILI